MVDIGTGIAHEVAFGVIWVARVNEARPSRAVSLSRPMNSYVSALFKYCGTSISCGTSAKVAEKLAELILRVDDDEKREGQTELGRAEHESFLLLLMDGPSKLACSKNSATSLVMRVPAVAICLDRSMYDREEPSY